MARACNTSPCAQALPPQPSTRAKREGSTGSFKSPLDQANTSSDRSSDLTSSHASDPSSFKFYQVALHFCWNSPSCFASHPHTAQLQIAASRVVSRCPCLGVCSSGGLLDGLYLPAYLLVEVCLFEDSCSACSEVVKASPSLKALVPGAEQQHWMG